MPFLTRPDGGELHYEVAGEDGPTVLFAPAFHAFPGVYRGVLDDLARDHRVLTYDPRGAGRSTRRGPYEDEVDVGDLVAVLETQPAPATLVGIGDGLWRAAIVADRRPDLARAVVSAGAGAFAARALGDSAGPAASPAAAEVFREMLRSDLRTGLRGIVRLTNDQMSEPDVRERVDQLVEYWEPEAAVARAEGGFAAILQGMPLVRTLGDRFWVLCWASEFVSRSPAERFREVLPDAHVEEVAAGAISRPDLTAAAIRRIAATS